MESVFPVYIFSLTVFSPEGQIQAICKRPGIDAAHLKLLSCLYPNLKSDFGVRKESHECHFPPVLETTGSAVLEAWKACA